MKGVTTIHLAFCSNITDYGLEYLKGVHKIDLEWCGKITDKGLEYLKGVRTIDIGSCNVTDIGILCLKDANAEVDITGYDLA